MSDVVRGCQRQGGGEGALQEAARPGKGMQPIPLEGSSCAGMNANFYIATGKQCH